MLAALRNNKLQRKILLVIVVIILVPMLITGILSASWIANRMDNSIAQRLRDSVRLDTKSLSDLHDNARLFANLLLEFTRGQEGALANPADPETTGPGIGCESRASV